jgi:sugar transferase (PEP-CTERM/EpsH1 system associated)
MAAMRNLLFLCHRFPYPPDRGEKIRIWHVLRHLARTHRIFLGCLVDDPRDWPHRPQVAALCAETGCFAIDKRRQKLLALARIRPGRPLMLDYYHHAGLHRWVAEVAARERIDAVYVFSTAMMPYAWPVAAPRRVLDMVDVDSEKWTEYARTASFPMRLVWAREGRTLLAYERLAARNCDRTLLVTEAESRRFTELAPESWERIGWLENGVDLAGFSPLDPAGQPYPDPYPASEDRTGGGPTGGGPWLALVGNMDYWPNADAADWFARAVLPLLRAGTASSHMPRLAIVGANPGPAVLALGALPGVLVTGRVSAVQPYLAHAAAVVAPLRIARGVQNKVLEGMAMGRPVIASPQAFEGIRAEPGRDLLVADGAAAMAQAVAEVLEGRHPGLGAAARALVEARYAWDVQLAPLAAMLDA